MYWVTICIIVFAMNRESNTGLSFSLYHLSSLQKQKRNHWGKIDRIRSHNLHILRSTATKQRFLNSSWIGDESDDIQIFIVRRILLYKPSIQKNSVIFFIKYASISPIAFNALYWKFRLVRLCQVFADPVTYGNTRLLILCTNKN